MELNKETLDQLKQNQTLEQINEHLSELSVDFKAIALPDGFNIENVEQLQRHRNLYRASYKTESIRSFKEYCARFAIPNSTCYIQAEDMTAKTIFDIGSIEHPEHCRHSARLELKRSPEFDEVLRVAERKFNQRDFAEWLEEWSEFLVPYNKDGVVMPVTTAVNLIRNLEFKDERKSEHRVDDFSESATMMEQASVQGNEGQLPCGFEFRCIPYVGLLFDGQPTTDEEKSEGRYSFKFRLTVSRSDNRPIFNLKALLLQQKLLQIADDFQARLTRDFKESGADINIYLGECSY